MTTTPSRSRSAWPGLDTVPSGRRADLAAPIARRIFHAAVRRLPVTVREGGTVVGGGGPVLVVRRPEEFYRRLGSDGLIGFGEAYLTGAWDAEDLGGFLTVLAAEMPRLVPGWMQRLRKVYVHRPPSMHRNTTSNTRDNIAHHYDLSNDLFRLFLDETLSYSSALFDTSLTRVVADGRRHLVAAPPEAAEEPLEDAQARKIERLLDQTGVGEGTRVLEVGTGWGELAIRAARRGATVHSVTLSSEQLGLAEARVAEAGLSDRVEIALCDYRKVQGQYDAIVSVEMIEAVGHEYWSTYFRTLERLLAPGGKIGVQAITMPHDRMLATRQTYTWINKYIFPGGFLPSVQAIDEIVTADTALRISERLSFGTHYAETLQRWDETFRAEHEAVSALGFDPTFERMWHFYLEYSRAGFASGYLDVQQLIFERTSA
ncbi:class I SAM-dependent methyltransferase [Nocardioides aurantiacus]|uniref:class I SAM-dependent methyltransferase n=1 Tax=Nocardioides aurantiacus TaxID=86796 RepID=UPI00403F4C53